MDSTALRILQSLLSIRSYPPALTGTFTQNVLPSDAVDIIKTNRRSCLKVQRVDWRWNLHY